MIDFLHEGQCLLDDMRCRCMGKETALHEQVREIHHLLDAHVKGWGAKIEQKVLHLVRAWFSGAAAFCRSTPFVLMS